VGTLVLAGSPQGEFREMIVAIGILAGVFLAIWQFMITYVLVYVSQHMGYNPIIIGLVGSMQSIGFITGLLFIMPRVELAKSFRGALIATPVIAALMLKGLFAADSVGVLMLMYVLYNINVAIFLVSVYNLISDIITADQWGAGLSKFRAISGLVMVLMVLGSSRIAGNTVVFSKTLFYLLLTVGAAGLLVVPRAPLIPQRSLYLLDVMMNKVSRIANGVVMAATTGRAPPSFYNKVISYALDGGASLGGILLASLIFKMGLDSIMVQIPPIAAQTVGSQAVFTAVALGLAGYTVMAYAADKTSNGKSVMTMASLTGILIALLLGKSLYAPLAFVAVYTVVYMLMGVFDVESAALAMRSDPNKIRLQPVAVNAGAVMGDILGGLVILHFHPQYLVYFSALGFTLALIAWRKV
jgi:hypothetical protein